MQSTALLPMRIRKSSRLILFVFGLAVGPGAVSAKPKSAPPVVPLTDAGQKLESQYSDTFTRLQAEIKKVLPPVDERKMAVLQQAREAVGNSNLKAEAAQSDAGQINTAKALVEHAKGKWIGGAEKGIAKAQADLKKATTDAEREAAKKDLAKWQANKEEGIKALKERQAAYEKAKIDAQKVGQANALSQSDLAKAKANEINAAQALLAGLDPYLASDKLDAKLIKCTVLAEATPRGLAEFAQQDEAKKRMMEMLLGDEKLMKEMLVAGGANFGKYGRAMEIYTAILKASAKAKEGNLQRLALATSLEFAVPVKQSNPEGQTGAPEYVDPVKRYLHYEKAYLDGELDPAFKNFNTWEYRLVVDCDAPDEILAWGREMLRNYRPDHIYSPDYGWRYSSTVRTEVPYGSQNVKCDLSSLHNYQNIIKDGGVCGRRAFFGRFILRCFGIPTWGVTQHAHAALSHWTPKGWVINLGAGFEHSWWDKDEVSLSGSQFLADSQARAQIQDYPKVLRAQWISRILGEPAYNDRKNVAGGFWSSMAHYQTLVLASKAVTLGPLGQELAEANEPVEKQKIAETSVSAEDQRIAVKDGAIMIPAAALGKSTGKSITMKSFAGGMQVHCFGGFTADYVFDAPRAGKYALSARVATVQEGQKFHFAINSAMPPIETAVPYTIGMWKQTEPVEVSLVSGKNTLHFGLTPESRGVTVKDFTLILMK